MSLIYCSVLYIHNVCRTQKIYFVILITIGSEITISMSQGVPEQWENQGAGGEGSTKARCELQRQPQPLETGDKVSLGGP